MKKLLLLLCFIVGCFIVGCSNTAQTVKRVPLLPTYDPSATLKSLNNQRSKLQLLRFRQAYLKATAAGGPVPTTQQQLVELDLEIKRSEARCERLRDEVEMNAQMGSLDPYES